MQSSIASRVKTFFLGDLIVSGLSHGDYFAGKEIEEVFIDVKVTAHFLEMGVDFRRNRRRIAICHPACEETAECGNGVVGLFLVALAARLCLSCTRFPCADGGRVVVLRGFPAPLADCFRRGAGHLQQEDYRSVAERVK